MLDVVIPVCSSDFYRFKILAASIQKFWKIDGNFFLIVPSKSYKLFKSHFGKRFEIIPEDALIPYIEFTKTSGWYRQQAIKLSAWPILTTDNFLVLDADCFLVRDTEEDYFVKDGKSGINLAEPGGGSWDEWYVESAKLLGTLKPALQTPVTPSMLNRNICKLLEQRIIELSNYYEKPWIWLLGREGWTEYTLYHCWAEYMNVWDLYHYRTDYALAEECVWKVEDFKYFNASDIFKNKKAAFTLVQSCTNIPAEWIWEKVKPFLIGG